MLRLRLVPGRNPASLRFDRLRELDAQFGNTIATAYSTTESIERLVTQADLVIGAVLVTGAAAPRLVTRDMVRRMEKGAVLVDI